LKQEIDARGLLQCKSLQIKREEQLPEASPQLASALQYLNASQQASRRQKRL
jgi:hypothetical protein